MCVCACVYVNKIPASKVQWPGTDENPLGDSLLDVAPLSRLSTIFSSWQRSDGEEGGGGRRRRRRRRWGRGAQSHVSGEMNGAVAPSVSHKLGSGRSHGTLLG